MTTNFVAIDLSQLPPPHAVEQLDYEQILAERKAYAISLWPEDQQAEIAARLALESEPLTKLLEENAYREMLWRQRVNEAALANMLASAQGADLDQLAEVFPAAAVEQLHGVARGVPQHAADVVGLGLGQVVLAEGERLVDEEAGQAHGDSRVVATGAQFTACRGALEPAPSERRGGDVQPGSRWSGWKSLTATLTASRVAMSMPSLATSARKLICSGVIT